MIFPQRRAIKKLLTLPWIVKWIVMLVKEPRPCNFVNSAAFGWKTHWTEMRYSSPSLVL